MWVRTSGSARRWVSGRLDSLCCCLPYYRCTRWCRRLDKGAGTTVGMVASGDDLELDLFMTDEAFLIEGRAIPFLELTVIVCWAILLKVGPYHACESQAVDAGDNYEEGCEEEGKKYYHQNIEHHYYAWLLHYIIYKFINHIYIYMTFPLLFELHGLFPVGEIYYRC